MAFNASSTSLLTQLRASFRCVPSRRANLGPSRTTVESLVGFPSFVAGSRTFVGSYRRKIPLYSTPIRDERRD
jgi:hypothetical protein